MGSQDVNPTVGQMGRPSATSKRGLPPRALHAMVTSSAIRAGGSAGATQPPWEAAELQSSGQLAIQWGSMTGERPCWASWLGTQP
jgi:hypothetical protein